MSFLSTSFGISSILFCNPKTGVPLWASQGVASIAYDGSVDMQKVYHNGGTVIDVGAGNASQELTIELMEINRINPGIEDGYDSDAVIHEVATTKSAALGDSSKDFAAAITGTVSANNPVVGGDIVIFANSANEVEVYATNVNGARSKEQFSFGKFAVNPGNDTVIDLSERIGVSITIEAAYTIKAKDSAWVTIIPAGSQVIGTDVFKNGTQLTNFRVVAFSEPTAEDSRMVAIFPKVAFSNPLSLTMTNKEVANQTLNGIALDDPNNGRGPMQFMHLPAPPLLD